ncbi:lysine exporter LysO family protein [Marinomonas arenicola]|uniref:lysine exporter LysO family protein n=1 Tax=Marinomonas arenicola TaxID=569601 RepID=UPI00311F6C1D
MTVITTLAPLLVALLFGYWVDIKFLSPKRVALGLEKLVYLILGLIGFSIGALDNLSEKLVVAGFQAFVLFTLVTLISLTALYCTGLRFGGAHAESQGNIPQASKRQALKDAAQTLAWVIVGILVGYIGKDWAMGVDQAVTGLLYILLLLVGCQLRQGNHRLKKMLLNKQAAIIAVTTIASTLFAGWLSGLILNLSWHQSLAVVSGFGWYSLSGILITGLGDPVLGTTAFLLDLSREIVALMLIPFFAKRSSHMSVGYSGATAMDFTLPMLSKFHGPEIVPVCIASGFIMSLLTPILIPLFLGMN